MDTETILAFLVVTSGSIKLQSLSVYRLAIRALHLDANLKDPTNAPIIKNFMAGHRRDQGIASSPMTAFRTEDVVAMCRHHDVIGGISAIRAKAMLLVAYSGALRGDEVVHVRREHLTFSSEGMILTIPKSKTDQEAVGVTIPIVKGLNLETCPVQAVKDFMEVIDAKLGSCSDRGWLFPALRPHPWASDSMRIYKVPSTIITFRKELRAAVEAIGLDPGRYATHSCPSGHATTVAKNGATLHDLMAHGRWASVKMAMVYIQAGRAFSDSTSNLLGL